MGRRHPRAAAAVLLAASLFLNQFSFALPAYAADGGALPLPAAETPPTADETAAAGAGLPSPDPAEDAAAVPDPTATPAPEAESNPVPTAAPAGPIAEPTAEPPASPTPAPEMTAAPEQTPEPTAVPQPAQTPVPTPAPIVTPESAATPAPAATPESAAGPAYDTVLAADTGAAPLPIAGYTPWSGRGNFADLVVFVNYADTTHDHPQTTLGKCYLEDPAAVLQAFNGSAEDQRGLRTYLYNISYGQLRVDTYFPQYDEQTGTFTPYTLTQSGSYYRQNETALVQEVIAQLQRDGRLPAAASLDLHGGDGLLDNLTIVVPCDNANRTDLFVNHKDTYPGTETLGGKRVANYNVITEGGLCFGVSSPGVVIHEFLHSVGYPDLYHNNGQGGGPVMQWDIMAAASQYVQYPLAYLRSAYTHWFDIETITESRQGLTLYAPTTADAAHKNQQAYILDPGVSADEFFVVEYRKKGAQYDDKGQPTTVYDRKIPGSGLIVYRVNKAQVSNVMGPPDLIYVFRPGDDHRSDSYSGEQGAGDIFSSFLSAESGRTVYGSSDRSKGLTDDAIVYSDGSNSGIVISNVGSAAGDTITFDVSFTKAGEYWTDNAKETDGTQTTEAATCFAADGTLYCLLKKGSSAVLYKVVNGTFQRLGGALAGSEFKLAESDGALYAACLTANYAAALYKWNGSGWTGVYTTAANTVNPTDMFALCADGGGAYLAYVNGLGTTNGVCVVRYDGSTAAPLGGAAASGMKYAAGPSIAAENGTVAVAWREAFNGNKLYVKQYTGGAWQDVGTQSLTNDNTCCLRLYDQKLYVCSNHTQAGGTPGADLYRCDLRAGGDWALVGGGSCSEKSIFGFDLCFLEGVPYLLYMTASEPYQIQAQYVADGGWQQLGANVWLGDVRALSVYSRGGQIWAAFLDMRSGKMVIRTHLPDGAGEYRGNVCQEQGGKWLYISDVSAGRPLSDEEILSHIAWQAQWQAPFAGIVLTRCGSAGAPLSKSISPAMWNAAVAALQPGGTLRLRFWEEDTRALTEWELTAPQQTDAALDAAVDAAPGEGGLWALTPANTTWPAAAAQARYARPELAAVYGEEGLSRPVYWYSTDSGKPVFAAEGLYAHRPAEESEFGALCTLTLPEAAALQSGAAYTARLTRSEWQMEYGYTVAADGSETPGTAADFDTLNDLLAALTALQLPAGTNVRLSGSRDHPLTVLPQAVLAACAQQKLTLQAVGRDGETGTDYTWTFTGLTGTGFPDLALCAPCTVGGAALPAEFTEWGYLYITLPGAVPAAESVQLTVARAGLCDGLSVPDGQVLNLWQYGGDAPVWLGTAARGADGESVTFAPEPAAAAYVLCAQAPYGWQRAEDGRWQYFENRTARPLTGWETVVGRRCYFDGAGYLAEGPTELGGVWYLFGRHENGTEGLCSGYAQVDAHWYDAGTDGVILTGWRKINERWHYFSAESDTFGRELPSQQQGGWVILDAGAGEMAGRRYYFKNNTTRLKGWQTIDSKRYYFTPDGYVQTGWYPDAATKNAYYLDDGDGHMLTGYQSITEGGEAHGYLFNASGVRQYGWQKINDEWRYFRDTAEAADYGREIGAEPLLPEWYRMEGQIYYFPGNTKPASGWKTIDGQRYYFDKTGRMYTGTQKIGSAFYHFRTDEGVKGMVGTGLFTDAKKTYYANNAGVLQRGWVKLDGAWRYFHPETGAELEGVIEPNYWARVEGPDGQPIFTYFVNGTAMAKGWRTIEGRKYYFDNDGMLQTGFFTVGKNTYYGTEATDLADCPGEAAVGWQTIGGGRYYFAKNNVMTVGWATVDGTLHLFDPAAESPARGRELDIGTPTADGAWTWYTVGDSTYCLKNNKTLLKGWQTVNGRRYYLDPDTGARTQNTARKIGNAWYAFDEAGVLRKNCAADGFGYNGSGVRVGGWQKLGGQWHYFDNTDKDPATWREIEGTTQGTAAGCWVTLGATGQKYFFRNGSTLLKGWQNIKGDDGVTRRYYFDPKTGALQTGGADGIFTIGKNHYYLGSDGVLRTGAFTEGGRAYYANTGGVLLAGWQKVGGAWAYYDLTSFIKDPTAQQTGNTGFAYATDGGVRHTWYFVSGKPFKGWRSIKGEDGKTYRYYFDASGIMLTQRAQIGKTWYFFGADGRMQTGFIRYCGAVYYFNAKGVMLTGWQRIDNVWHCFDTVTGQEYAVTGSDGNWRTVQTPAGRERAYLRGSTVLKGWQNIKENGVTRRYYFDANGFQWTQAKGWLVIGSNRFRFDAAQNDSVYKGFLTLPGEGTYYLNANGQMLKGWQSIKGADGKTCRYYLDPITGIAWMGACQVGKNWYYFDPGQNGRMATGHVPIGREWYCFNTAGVRLTGWQRDGADWYYYDPADGRRCATTALGDGWWQTTLADGSIQKAYVRKNAVVKGWQNIKGADGVTRRYYFDANGFRWTQAKGWLIIGSNRFWFDAAQDDSVCKGFLTPPDSPDEKTYYLNANGQALKGWQTIRTGGTSHRYYFAPTTGAMYTGHCQIGGKWYDLGEDGIMRTGYVETPGGNYDYNASGVLLTGWQKLKGETVPRYFDPDGNADGTCVGVERSWTEESAQTVGRNVYHRRVINDPDAKQPVQRFCFLNNSTVPLRGKQKIDGKLYWFHSSTGALYTGSFNIGQTRYRSNPDGSVYTGFDPADPAGADPVHYYNANGQRVTGWLTLKTGGVTDKYYLNANGVLVKGIYWIGNTRYLFDSVSGRLVTSNFSKGACTVDNGRAGIPIDYQLPKSFAGAPLVVLCHGFCGSRQGDGHFAPLARDLADKGIACVRLDFAGCGTSKEPGTGYTLTNMVKDVDTVIGWMGANFGVDTEKLAMVGHSMGGRLVSLYTQQGQYEPLGIALWSPANGDGLQGLEFLDINSFAHVQELAAEAERTGTATAWGFTMSDVFFREMAESHPNRALQDYKGQILLFYTPNERILSENTVAAATAAVQAAARGAVVPRSAFAEAGHNYTAADPDQAKKLDPVLDACLRQMTLDDLLLPALTGAGRPEAAALLPAA